MPTRPPGGEPPAGAPDGPRRRRTGGRSGGSGGSGRSGSSGRRDAKAALRLESIPPEVAEVLLAIPGTIDADARPEIRTILFPDAYGDDELDAEWRRMAHPELEHLFASARTLVERDLAGLRATLDDPLGCRLVIPHAHRQAWISALQQCLQILRGEHRFTPQEIEGDFAPDASFERREALWRVHTLYVFQGILIDAEAGDADPPAAT